MVDRLAKRVVGNVQLASHLRFGKSFFQQLPSLFDDFGVHHRSPASSSRLVEALDALLAIFTDRPQHATFGDAKGPDNIGLLDGPLDAELCGEHAKGFLIPFSMLEDRLYPAEIDPLSILPHEADGIVDAGRPLGNQWQ